MRREDDEDTLENNERFNKQLETSIGFLESGKYCSIMIINLINDMMDLAKTE